MGLGLGKEIQDLIFYCARSTGLKRERQGLDSSNLSIILSLHALSAAFNTSMKQKWTRKPIRPRYRSFKWWCKLCKYHERMIIFIFRIPLERTDCFKIFPLSRRALISTAARETLSIQNPTTRIIGTKHEHHLLVVVKFDPKLASILVQSRAAHKRRVKLCYLNQQFHHVVWCVVRITRKRNFHSYLDPGNLLAFYRRSHRKRRYSVLPSPGPENLRNWEDDISLCNVATSNDWSYVKHFNWNFLVHMFVKSDICISWARIQGILTCSNGIHQQTRRT